ncbi:PAS domain-containing protein, partial [Salmonella enterica]|uniref:PAS domain-containing protein n=1 Tax=Salmonella enterica TaxID=28901 RepID=UPI003D2AEE2B
VIMNCIHPEDRAWFLGCQDAAIKFLVSLPPEKHLKYKLRFDCRFRKKNGKYLRMIQQAIVINTDENGGVLKTLIVLTDVTHLKT